MSDSEGTKSVLQSPVRLWAALLIAAAVVSILVLTTWLFERGQRRDVIRWSKGGDLQETDDFVIALNHPQDQGQWQAGLRNTPFGSDENPDYALPRVSVYSVPNIHPAHAKPTLRDLGDRAQVRAIEAIEKGAVLQRKTSGAAARPWEDLRKTLSSEDEPGEKDPFLFERVLVATVAKGVKWPPGDRMVWTRIFVQPINFKFAAYTIASTENETVKVSSQEATAVRKLSADIGLAIPSLDGSKIGLAPSSESTVKTTSDVSTQYERLGVDIMPMFLRIVRESGAGGDVIGNTTVSLSLTTDYDLIARGKDKTVPEADINLVVTGVDLDDDVKIPSIDVLPLVPLPHCALRAKLSAIYEQRHIKKGREFFDESRQNVVFIHDVDKERTIELMGADDVSPFVWGIQLVPEGEKPGKWDLGKLLRASYHGNGNFRQLVFSDYGRAVKLAHWVRTHHDAHVGPSGYTFNWPGDKTGLAVVKKTGDDCRENEVVVSDAVLGRN
jgi:hypothetical protein